MQLLCSCDEHWVLGLQNRADVEVPYSSILSDLDCTQLRTVEVLRQHCEPAAGICSLATKAGLVHIANMDPGLIDDLTGRTLPANIPCQEKFAELQTEAASLNIEDAPQRHVPQAMGYEMDPPPPPKIHSKGIVATDITEHFRSACQGVLCARD